MNSYAAAPSDHHSTTVTAIPYNPYFKVSPAPPPMLASDHLNHLGKRLEGASRKAESLIGNLYHHIRTGSSLIDVAATRIAQGTKVLTEGGCDKVFRRWFGEVPGEKFTEAYVCYLSTTAVPVMGTLYITNKRVAFCSDYPARSGVGAEQWVYYKVEVAVDQLVAVKPSANVRNPSEKYIQIVTRDGHEFWFMGFVWYDKALKDLYKAMDHNYTTRQIPIRHNNMV